MEEFHSNKFSQRGPSRTSFSGVVAAIADASRLARMLKNSINNTAQINAAQAQN